MAERKLSERFYRKFENPFPVRPVKQPQVTEQPQTPAVKRKVQPVNFQRDVALRGGDGAGSLGETTERACFSD